MAVEYQHLRNSKWILCIQFVGTSISNCYYKGTFWDKSKQMTLFRAQTDFNGEKYAKDWQLANNRNVLVANVFNATSHWRVVAIEDGKEYLMRRISSKGQDAFAAGYHHKYSESVSYRFVSKGNGYLIMNHLYYYTPRNPNARIIIKASDPYGNTYTASSDEVTTEPFANFAHYYEKSIRNIRIRKTRCCGILYLADRKIHLLQGRKILQQYKIKREGAS